MFSGQSKKELYLLSLPSPSKLDSVIFKYFLLLEANFTSKKKVLLPARSIEDLTLCLILFSIPFFSPPFPWFAKVFGRRRPSYSYLLLPYPKKTLMSRGSKYITLPLQLSSGFVTISLHDKFRLKFLT